jgi:ubiquinone/menaquinone biosynthesis C-methylase UbiE
MLFEAALPEQLDRVDFSRRAQLSELMDEPSSYEELRACLRDLEQVNRVTFGYRPTLRLLEQFVDRAREGEPLHIVDVGCGGGDMLRRIRVWAGRRQIAVRLTGIDLNPNAVRAAREFTPAGSGIRWVSGNAYSFDAAADPVGVVISSLFTHHLPDDEIVRFLKWMERVARSGWFVNDLSRSRTPYLGFKALAAVMRWHRFVRHDGPVSFRRAFLPEEWRKYVESAGLPQNDVRIDGYWPARLCVARVKAQ